jgi:murein DD-endopeptidase MepM/ murein hydrolase activator NlpD
LIFNQKKYYFNPGTLTYEEIKNKRSRSILSWIALVSLAIAVTFVSGYFLNRVFDSHESRFLEKQVAMMNGEMKHLSQQVHQVSQSLRNDIIKKDNTYRTILQMDTLSYSLRNAGTGGSAADNEMTRQLDLTYRVGNMIKSLNNQLQIQSGSFNALYEKAMEYAEGQTHLPAIQPVDQKDLTMISSHFGVRSDPFNFVEKIHFGLDFVAPAGTNVYATGDGIVTFAQYSRTGYGNEIVMDHRFGFGSRYAHLRTMEVKVGEQVKRGQIIGTVGETGRATGPHLHYEVLYHQQPVNPSFYFDTTLTKEEYAQIINKAITADKLN